MAPHFAADSMDTVIKQRMQLHQSEFRSVFDCARTVYRNEGLFAFYVSYPTTLTMTIPFAACQFAVYERTKKLLNPKGEYSPVIHVVAGGMAGAVGAAVTTPLDVAKTLLQTRGTSHDPEIRSCRGMLHAFRIIWMRDGLRGFSRGLTPRVLTHMPSNALSWLSYEFFSASIPIVTQDKLINSLPNRGSNPRPMTSGIDWVHVNNLLPISPHLISCLLSSHQYDIAAILQSPASCSMGNDNPGTGKTMHGSQIKRSLRLSTSVDDHPHPQLQTHLKRSFQKRLVAKIHSTLHQCLG